MVSGSPLKLMLDAHAYVATPNSIEEIRNQELLTHLQYRIYDFYFKKGCLFSHVSIPANYVASALKCSRVSVHNANKRFIELGVLDIISSYKTTNRIKLLLKPKQLKRLEEYPARRKTTDNIHVKTLYSSYSYDQDKENRSVVDLEMIQENHPETTLTIPEVPPVPFKFTETANAEVQIPWSAWEVIQSAKRQLGLTQEVIEWMIHHVINSNLDPLHAARAAVKMNREGRFGAPKRLSMPVETQKEEQTNRPPLKTANSVEESAERNRRERDEIGSIVQAGKWKQHRNLLLCKMQSEAKGKMGEMARLSQLISIGDGDQRMLDLLHRNIPLQETP